VSRSLAHGRSEFMDHLPNVYRGPSTVVQAVGAQHDVTTAPGGEKRKKEVQTMRVRELMDKNIEKIVIIREEESDDSPP